MRLGRLAPARRQWRACASARAQHKMATHAYIVRHGKPPALCAPSRFSIIASRLPLPLRPSMWRGNASLIILTATGRPFHVASTTRPCVVPMRCGMAQRKRQSEREDDAHRKTEGTCEWRGCRRAGPGAGGARRAARCAQRRSCAVGPAWRHVVRGSSRRARCSSARACVPSPRVFPSATSLSVSRQALSGSGGASPRGEAASRPAATDAARGNATAAGAAEPHAGGDPSGAARRRGSMARESAAARRSSGQRARSLEPRQSSAGPRHNSGNSDKDAARCAAQR